MPAAKASVPPPTQQNAVSSSIPAIPAPPPPASSDMASSAQNVPAVPITAPNSAPPPPPSNTKVVPRRSFAINGADFLQQKSALKKARPRRQRNNKQQSKGKQKLTANATPKKMSLADGVWPCFRNVLSTHTAWHSRVLRAWSICPSANILVAYLTMCVGCSSQDAA